MLCIVVVGYQHFGLSCVIDICVSNVNTNQYCLLTTRQACSIQIILMQTNTTLVVVKGGNMIKI